MLELSKGSTVDSIIFNTYINELFLIIEYVTIDRACDVLYHQSMKWFSRLYTSSLFQYSFSLENASSRLVSSSFFITTLHFYGRVLVRLKVFNAPVRSQFFNTTPPSYKCITVLQSNQKKRHSLINTSLQ